MSAPNKKIKIFLYYYVKLQHIPYLLLEF